MTNLFGRCPECHGTGYVETKTDSQPSSVDEDDVQRIVDAKIERQREEIRRQALEEAAKAADQLPQKHHPENCHGSAGWTAYVQSRRDAVKAIRRLIAVPPAAAPERAKDE